MLRNLNDIEVPVIFGRRFGKWGYLWGGPKYIFGKYTLDADISVVGATDVTPTDGKIHYVGGFTGFGAGYKFIYAFVELTVMNMFAKPVILGHERDIGGIIVMPSFGLMARW